MFVDCENPVEALGFWYEYLVDYPETSWAAPTWQVWRQQSVQGTAYDENFAFQVNDVVMCGLNLVSGTYHDAGEWQQRHQANLIWIAENYEYYRRNAGVMVILLHAGPSFVANDDFYEPLFVSIEQSYLDMQFIVVHRGDGNDAAAIQYGYRGITNLAVASVQASSWPPMRMQISTANGLQVDMNQDDWFYNLTV